MNAMSGGNRFNKKFSSLEKRGSGGVHPINSLKDIDNKEGSTNEGKGSPTNAKRQLNAIFGGQVDSSRSLRENIENNLQEPRPASDLETKARSPQKVKTVGDEIVDIRALGIAINQGETLTLRSVLINGNLYQQSASGDLVLRFSVDDCYIFVVLNKSIIATAKKEEIKGINFSSNRRAIMMELEDPLGYIYMKHLEDDSQIYRYCSRNKFWQDKNPKREDNEWLLDMIKRLQRRNSRIANRRKERNVQSTPTRMQTTSPELMYGKTRSSKKLQEQYSPLNSKVINQPGDVAQPISIKDEELHKSNTVPEPFDIELKYVFQDNKVFTITYSDFKTLYNNDWINDSLIDFFIKYEMDKAIYEKKLFKESDIYAFNSFFFTKLMWGNENESVDYYGNIKRWLNKLDLMSYPNIIIPINENLHWYCGIIKGLPRLLEMALKRKASTQIDLIKNDEAKDNTDGDVQSSDPIDSTTESLPVTPESASKEKKIYQPEIFIFDSLRQRHSNIYFPLKKFIIDYCKERYDVLIEKNEIRVHSAKVPKQNNFNDCGIHVIYNVKKWLNNSEECERVWRSANLRSASRALFVAEERNGMRKELRDMLLDLKKKQIMEQGDSNKQHQENDEDDIEVIEYTPVKNGSPANSPCASGGQSSTNQTTEDEDPFMEAKKRDDDSVTARTLDPKVRKSIMEDSQQESRSNISSSPSSDTTHLGLKNKTLQAKLFPHLLSNTLKEVLNEYFDRNEKIDDVHFQKVIDLRDKINDLDDIKHRSIISKAIKFFINESNELVNEKQNKITRPKDQDLVIMHCSDNEELNKSVNGLSLCNASDDDSSDSEITNNKLITSNNEKRKSSSNSDNINAYLYRLTKVKPSQLSDVDEDVKVVEVENQSPQNRRVINILPEEVCENDSPEISDKEHLSKFKLDQDKKDIRNEKSGNNSRLTSPKSSLILTNGSTFKRRKLDKTKHKH